jgi:hypothetical protein
MNLPYFAVQLTNISCMDEHEALQRMAAAAAFQHRPQDCALQERQDCEAISQTAGETASAEVHRLAATRSGVFAIEQEFSFMPPW